MDVVRAIRNECHCYEVMVHPLDHNIDINNNQMRSIGRFVNFLIFSLSIGQITNFSNDDDYSCQSIIFDEL